ncbi:flagellar type III secretion system protein FlhB [Leptospira weilii]|nr:EscU/YscU/HrcU family type III secretion system export apparatus switch protein [Leptospira weilii]UPY77526.1 flagellar type III secretion system protein FlhB [Leptospira weilii]
MKMTFWKKGTLEVRRKTRIVVRRFCSTSDTFCNIDVVALFSNFVGNHSQRFAARWQSRSLWIALFSNFVGNHSQRFAARWQSRSLWIALFSNFVGNHSQRFAARWQSRSLWIARFLGTPTITPTAADFKINLQLFAAEDEGRTEPGSERRRREEREKGNVPKSPELPAAVVLLAGVILIYLMGEYFFMRTFYILRKYIHGVGLKTDISSESVTELLKNASADLFTLLWPLLGITLVGAVIGNVAQVGFIFAPRALSFNFSRIRPNFKKVLPTRQTLFNLGKSLAKVGLIAWVSYIIISKDFFPILISGEMGLEQAVALVMSSSFKIFLVVGIILLAISVVDYLYQRYEYEESLKMTPSEAKREAKESDGDRSLQARRRQLARDMMNKRKMLAKVPEADVVITNPTHFAVALEYKPGIHKAPIVIAKGVDDFALLIIRIARENGVPTVEDRIQARGLYEEVELGAEVPQQFYRAIATILSRLESFRKAV